jgi:hypothetical protein
MPEQRNRVYGRQDVVRSRGVWSSHPPSYSKGFGTSTTFLSRSNIIQLLATHCDRNKPTASILNCFVFVLNTEGITYNTPRGLCALLPSLPLAREQSLGILF